MCISMYSEVPTQSTSVVIWKVNQKPRTTRLYCFPGHHTGRVNPSLKWVWGFVFWSPHPETRSRMTNRPVSVFEEMGFTSFFSFTHCKSSPFGGYNFMVGISHPMCLQLRPKLSFWPSYTCSLMSKGCQGRADLLRRLLFHSFISEDFSYFLGRSVVLSTMCVWLGVGEGG